MKIYKVKISELPLIKSLSGFVTIGVGPNGESYKADLGFVEDSAIAASQAAQRADDASDSANSAAQEANAAAGSANSAADRVDTLIQEASEAASNANTAADAANAAVDAIDAALGSKPDVGNVLPEALGVAAAGTSGNASREDHVHPAEDALKATSGYVKLPSGIMLQWGSFNIPYQSPMQSTVTFPTAFTAAPYQIVITPTSFNGQEVVFGVAATSPTLTNFVARMSASGLPSGILLSVSFGYIATGRWK